jgi:glycosyltransferase involved in cell wall biosynthesis
MKIKIAIDVSPLKSAHKFRGIGFYTENLVKALQSFGTDKLTIKLAKTGRASSDCDLIHYPYFDFFKQTLPLVKKLKTIVTIHDVIPLVFPKHYPPGVRGRLNFCLQMIALKGVKAVICDSQNSKRDIFKYLHYPQEKIFAVYLAPGDRFKPIDSQNILNSTKQKYNLPEKFVLYVGDVNYNKNLVGLAKACKTIGMPLVIVGKQAVQQKFDVAHIENQPLVQLVKLYDGDKDIRRLGFVPTEDLIAIYNLATVYCQPSFYEGFGLPVLEAMSCGTPVVCSNRSSLPEIAGEAAILVNPYNINSIATGLKRAINNKDLRKKLIEKGLGQARKFSWEKVAKETYEVYKKVAQE